MGGSSSKHTVKVYNYMDEKPDVTLSFDGDDGVHITAADHCYGPSKNGGSCKMSCNHKHCDLKICQANVALSATTCDTDLDIYSIGNVDEDYLLLFSYSFAIPTNVSPNEEHFYIYNQGNEDIKLKGTPVSDDGSTDYSIPSDFNIPWTTISEKESMGFSTLSFGRVDITLKLFDTKYVYTIEQGKCYSYVYYNVEYADGRTSVVQDLLEDEDCSNSRRRELLNKQERSNIKNHDNDKGNNGSSSDSTKIRVTDDKIVPNHLRGGIHGGAVLGEWDEPSMN